jgi:hypothetical protein
MMAALDYVARHPGCSKSDAGRREDGGRVYADPVERLIRRGWLKAEYNGARKGCRLYVTGEGNAARGESAR